MHINVSNFTAVTMATYSVLDKINALQILIVSVKVILRAPCGTIQSR